MLAIELYESESNPPCVSPSYADDSVWWVSARNRVVISWISSKLSGLEDPSNNAYTDGGRSETDGG